MADEVRSKPHWAQIILFVVLIVANIWLHPALLRDVAHGTLMGWDFALIGLLGLLIAGLAWMLWKWFRPAARPSP